MGTIVVGVFDSFANARQAATALGGAGFRAESLSVVLDAALLNAGPTPFPLGSSRETLAASDGENAPSVVCRAGLLVVGPLAAWLNRAGLRADTVVLAEILAAGGFGKAVARYLNDAVNQGAVLLVLECADDRSQDARDAMRKHAALPVRPELRGHYPSVKAMGKPGCESFIVEDSLESSTIQ